MFNPQQLQAVMALCTHRKTFPMQHIMFHQVSPAVIEQGAALPPFNYIYLKKVDIPVIY